MGRVLNCFPCCPQQKALTCFFSVKLLLSSPFMLNINSLHISGKISSSVDVILLYINTLGFPLNCSRCSLRCLWRRDVGTLLHFDFTVIKHTEQQIPTCTPRVNNAWLSGQLAEVNIFWCVTHTDTLTEKVRQNYHTELSIRGDFCRSCRKHEHTQSQTRSNNVTQG